MRLTEHKPHRLRSGGFSIAVVADLDRNRSFPRVAADVDEHCPIPNIVRPECDLLQITPAVPAPTVSLSRFEPWKENIVLDVDVLR